MSICRIFLSALPIVGLCAVCCLAQTPNTEYLSDHPDRIWDTEQSWGRLGFDTATHIHGQPPQSLRIVEKEYTKGIGTHANSEIVIALDGEYTTFEAEIGLQHENPGTAVFQVYVDEKRLFDSGVMRVTDTARPINIPVTGARRLRLVVGDADDGIANDRANWADARLVRNPNVKLNTAAELTPLDMAPFAGVTTSDPNRAEGCRAGRLDEFRAEDLFLDTEMLPSGDGTYTVPVTGGLGCIGLQWAERRVLSEISLSFAGDGPSTDGVRVEYWSSQGRMDEWAVIGQTLWQGQWDKLPGKLERHGDTWVFRINRDVPEFVSRDGTHRIRWITPASGKPIVVSRLSALTRSRWTTGRFRLELEHPLPGKQADVEIYNGYIGGDASNVRRKWDLGSPLDLDLRYVTSPRVPDRTLIRVNLPDGATAIAVNDIVANDCVYMRDLGLFAATRPAEIGLAEYKKKIADRKTVLERVREMPDQTFSHAKEVLFNPISDRDPILISLACDARKFWVMREGGIQFNTQPEYPRSFQPIIFEHEIWPHFGSGKNEGLTRRLTDRWMPIPVTTVKENNIVYRQRTFVAPSGDPLPSAPEWLNSKPLGVSEFTIENQGSKPADASLSLAFAVRTGKAGTWDVDVRPDTSLQQVPSGLIVEQDGKLVAFVDVGVNGPLTAVITDNTMSLTGDIPGKGAAKIVVYMPAWDVPVADYASLRGGEKLLPKVKSYWKRILSPAMQIDVPEPLLNDVFIANQIHALLAARNLDGGVEIAPYAAAMSYGPLDTEAQAPVLAMDLLGHHEFAGRCHDYFLNRYNEKGALANGYTLMGTGQSLWTIGQHYGLTKDKEWLSKVAPILKRSAGWIAEQREKTKKLDPHGEKMPEYGMMPPGVLADWDRYAYYFYANGYYYAGLESVARMLSDIGDEDAALLLGEASRYRTDILRAYRWNQARMAALPLSDGTHVPAYPSSLYCFGLTRDFYKGISATGHDVEVGGNHLINHGVIDPKSNDAEWITNYMEDNWFFLYPGLSNYPQEKMKEDWFTYGGFAKLQPYYVRNVDVYALRDDVKPFIRSYFNSFFPMLSTETLALWEHFNGQGAANKTHESAWLLQQTRMMLLMERENDLWLAPFVTNNWMKDGMVVRVKNAPSCFGRVGYKITSRVSRGYIEAEIDPPTRNSPKYIVLRLRHPEDKRIQSVTINGSPHRDFDPAKECIRIKAGKDRITVRADYR